MNGHLKHELLLLLETEEMAINDTLNMKFTIIKHDALRMVIFHVKWVNGQKKKTKKETKLGGKLATLGG